MTSREGYDAYTLYLGIKLHFHSKGYDFVKYNGKVKSDINSFLKRKDKYQFGKLFKTHKHELQNFYIANLSHKDYWAVDEECNKRFKEWKGRQQKLSYMFKTEVSDMLQKKTINKLLEVKEGQHPLLLKHFLARKVSIETICIMDEIIGFSKDWDRLIEEKYVYPDVQLRLNKYKSFISVDLVKYKKELMELCQK
jgi:hypothetical protein